MALIMTKNFSDFFQLFSGLDLAPWQKVDMATLAPALSQFRWHHFHARL